MTASGVVYARKMDGKLFTFDFVNALVGDNLLFADRETGSLWSQLDGKAIGGPMKDTPLVVVPAIQSTWMFWHKLHPDTRVAVVKGGGARPYRYRNPERLSHRAGSAGDSHDTSALGLGVAFGREAVWYSLGELGRGVTPLQETVGGQKITIQFARDGLTAWAEDSQGTLLPAVLAYRKGWLRFHPRSRIFQRANKSPPR